MSTSVTESLRHTLTVDGRDLQLTLISGEKGTSGADGPNTVTSATDSDGTAYLSVQSLTGDVTGNLTGDVTGNLTGDVTGDVTGNLTGDVTGDVTGNSTGDVTGNVTGNLTGDVTGNLTGDVTGNLTGDVTAVDGTFTGAVTTEGLFVGDGSMTNLSAINGYFTTVGTQSISAWGITVDDGNDGGDVSAVSGTFTGNVNASIVTANTITAGASGEFGVSSVGNVTAADGTFTGDVTSVDGTFTADVFTGNVNASIITAGASGEFGVSSVGNVTAADGTFTGNVTAEGGDSTKWNEAYTDRTPFSVITGTGGQTHIRYKSAGWLKSQIDAIDTSFGASDIEAVIFGTEVPTIESGILKNQVGLKFVDFGKVPTVFFESCMGCSGLERVIMRATDKIGKDAFNGCSSLTYIDLGSVTTIGFYAFKDCVDLTSVTIPSAITVLGNNVFVGCSSLSEVNCYANYSVFDPSSGNVFKNTASPLTIHAKPNTGWTAASGISFQGNPNVTIILDLV